MLIGFETKYDGCTGYNYAYCDSGGCGCKYCVQAYYDGDDDYGVVQEDGTTKWLVHMGTHSDDED